MADTLVAELSAQEMTDSSAMNLLMKQNQQLIRDLKITEKLLESYRKCLQMFAANCVCDHSRCHRPKSETLDKYYDQYVRSKSSRVTNTDELDETRLTKNEITSSTKKSFTETATPADPCLRGIDVEDESTEESQTKSHEVIPSEDNLLHERTVNTVLKTKPRLKIDREPYPCRQEVLCEEIGCGKVFKCIQNMRKHVKTVHLGLRPFACDWPGCESAFKTREAMTNHKSVHCDDRNFKCQFDGCQKTFKLRCKLTQHLRCHGIGPKNERFPCNWPACGIFCQSEQALTEHLNRHQNIRPFVCPMTGCGKAYFTSFELKQHSMKLHEQSESFRCDFAHCNMVFFNKRDLSKHRRLHHDMAKFVCSWPECSHTFSTSKELTDHMNRHLDIRANKCQFIGCARSYFTRKDLSRHVRKAHSS